MFKLLENLIEHIFHKVNFKDTTFLDQHEHSEGF